MSGAHFNYAESRIKTIIEDIEIEIGDTSFHYWSSETQEEFYNGLYALKRARVFAKRLDFLLAGDDAEDTFHTRLHEELAELSCPSKCKGCCSLVTKVKCHTCGKQPLLTIEEPENSKYTTRIIENTELADTAMRFVDRSGDTGDIDTAEEICAEFYKAMSAIVLKYHPNGRKMENKEKEYLTLVYKNPPKELVEELTSKDECVFMSWSHVPNERDAAAKKK